MNITKEQLSGLPLYHIRKSKTITMAIFRTDGTTETITLPTKDARTTIKQIVGEYQITYNMHLRSKVIYINKANQLRYPVHCTDDLPVNPFIPQYCGDIIIVSEDA
jgi:hypothetical protein